MRKSNKKWVFLWVFSINFYGFSASRYVMTALDELNSFGRASKIQLAVMVDRGHRELPIGANFIGKNIQTLEGEHVNVFLKETDSNEGVYLLREESVATK